eukprot:8132609-Ditylum_brightwellii.AAC.1
MQKSRVLSKVSKCPPIWSSPPQGSGFLHIHGLHTTARTKHIIKHIRANTYRGKAAEIML